MTRRFLFLLLPLLLAAILAFLPGLLVVEAARRVPALGALPDIGAKLAKQFRDTAPGEMVGLSLSAEDLLSLLADSGDCVRITLHEDRMEFQAAVPVAAGFVNFEAVYITQAGSLQLQSLRLAGLPLPDFLCAEFFLLAEKRLRWTVRRVFHSVSELRLEGNLLHCRIPRPVRDR